MFAKYDESGNMTALVYGCEPEDKTEYIEIPDDEDAANAFFAQQMMMSKPAQTAEERIEALEEQLAAAKILLGVE